MAYIFNLWNPYKTGERTLEFDISPANSPRLRHGTKEFVEACLSSLGLSCYLKSWEVLPLRSLYFSDYPAKDESWEDRWPSAWHFRVHLESTIDRQFLLSGLPVCIDEIDKTWELESDKRDSEDHALIVAVFLGNGTVYEEFEKNVENELSKYIADTSQCVRAQRTYTESIHQLRLLISSVRFPEWIEKGDLINLICSRFGGIVNFRRLLLRT